MGGNGSGRGGSHSPLEGEVKTESKEMIDGPNGPGGVETVSITVNGVASSSIESLRADGGVTQGELLRQEQRAGVVPAAQLRGERGDSDGMGEDDEMPHARGPEEIGMEDMGPQAPGSGATERLVGSGVAMQGIDIEAAVGRKVTSSEPTATSTTSPSEKQNEPEAERAATPKREAEEYMGGEGKRLKPESEAGSEDGKGIADGDTDMELVDVDVKMEEEEKVGEKGENKGADAVDSTTV